MSSIVTFDPNNVIVANVVTAFQEGVDPITPDATHLVDPDYSQVGGMQGCASGTCKANAVNNAVVPFSGSDSTAWASAQAAAQVASTDTQAKADVSATQDVPIAARAATVDLALRLNEMIAWATANFSTINPSLPGYTPGPILSCPQTPFTKAQGETDVTTTISSGAVNT